MAHVSLTNVRSLLVAALALTVRVAAAQQATEPVRALLQSGTLSFSAHATAGDFVGSTSSVAGAVTGDLSQPRGWVEARVATLVTHNDHRDRDLRASMEVEKYPTMRFDLDRTTPDSSATSGRTMLHGRLTIHGVTRPLDVAATISRVGDTVLVTTAFPLKLGDYQIGGLTKMFGLLRMDPRIDVKADLHFIVTESFNP